MSTARFSFHGDLARFLRVLLVQDRFRKRLSCVGDVPESIRAGPEKGGMDIAMPRNMASIVNLSDYRRPAKPVGAPAQDQPQYFCTRCDSADFKLYASGEVRCAHCHALIRNVAVAETRSG